jgi:hypothetical protein
MQVNFLSFWKLRSDVTYILGPGLKNDL